MSRCRHRYTVKPAKRRNGTGADHCFSHGGALLGKFGIAATANYALPLNVARQAGVSNTAIVGHDP